MIRTLAVGTLGTLGTIGYLLWKRKSNIQTIQEAHLIKRTVIIGREVLLGKYKITIAHFNHVCHAEDTSGALLLIIHPTTGGFKVKFIETCCYTPEQTSYYIERNDAIKIVQNMVKHDIERRYDTLEPMLCKDVIELIQTYLIDKVDRAFV
jgi:hypothetical protein